MSERRTRPDRGRPLASLTLPGSSSSARTARDLLRDELGGRFSPSVLDDLLLLVSELVGNAATATSELLWLTVTCDDDMLRVELIHGSELLPQLDDRGPLAEDGRGLLLVDALAFAWGAVPRPSGKMVWFTLRVHTPRRSLSLLTDQVGHQGYDIEKALTEPVAVDDVAPAVGGDDAVADVEGWFHTQQFRIRPDGTQNEHLSIVGVTPLSPSLELTLIEGRWFTDTGHRPVVIHTHSADDEGDLEVGDEVVLDIEGHKRLWSTVGVPTTTPVGPLAYLPVQALTNAIGLPDQAHLLAVQGWAWLSGSTSRSSLVASEPRPARVAARLTVRDTLAYV